MVCAPISHVAAPCLLLVCIEMPVLLEAVSGANYSLALSKRKQAASDYIAIDGLRSARTSSRKIMRCL
jgi:hypothetical protein